MAQCLLRECRAVRASHGLAISETVSMKKPPTGEPYARKPPVRFGGRGRCKPIPTPIILCVRAVGQELRDRKTSLTPGLWVPACAGTTSDRSTAADRIAHYGRHRFHPPAHP